MLVTSKCIRSIQTTTSQTCSPSILRSRRWTNSLADLVSEFRPRTMLLLYGQLSSLLAESFLSPRSLSRKSLLYRYRLSFWNENFSFFTDDIFGSPLARSHAENFSLEPNTQQPWILERLLLMCVFLVENLACSITPRCLELYADENFAVVSLWNFQLGTR